jgi:cell wall-associated NlpC family hydrolase
LLVVSANSVGLDLSEVDDAHYPEATDGRLLAERLEACAVKMPDGTPPAIGDVLLFKVAGVATHVGVATGAGRMVHAYRAVGKVVEHDLGAKWSRRLVGVYRLGATE